MKHIPAVFFISLLILGGISLSLYHISKSKEKNSQMINIGVMLPLSGDASTFGYGTLKGIQLAKKNLGADDIELVLEDTGCDPAKTKTGIEHLLEKHVLLIIGEACSGASLAALPYANEHNIVLLSPASSSPKLSIADDYFFRLVPPDTQQGKVAAKLISEQGHNRVSLIYTNEPYGVDLTTVFRESFLKLGGAIVSAVSIERDDVNLENQVQQALSQNPDAIYLVSNSPTSTVAVLRLIRNKNKKIEIFGSDAMQDKSILKNGGEAIEGLIITAFPLGSSVFRKSLRAEYGPAADGFYGASQGYDAFKAVYLAIQKGATKKEDFKTIFSTLEFDGVSSYITFDENGEVSDKYTYDILQVKDGSFIHFSP